MKNKRFPRGLWLEIEVFVKKWGFLEKEVFVGFWAKIGGLWRKIEVFVEKW